MLAPAYVMKHVLERAGQKNDGIEQEKYEGACAQKQDIVSLPERLAGIGLPAQVVIESIQAQVMRKVL